MRNEGTRGKEPPSVSIIPTFPRLNGTVIVSIFGTIFRIWGEDEGIHSFEDIVEYFGDTPDNHVTSARTILHYFKDPFELGSIAFQERYFRSG